MRLAKDINSRTFRVSPPMGGVMQWVMLHALLLLTAHARNAGILIQIQD